MRRDLANLTTLDSVLLGGSRSYTLPAASPVRTPQSPRVAQKLHFGSPVRPIPPLGGGAAEGVSVTLSDALHSTALSSEPPPLHAAVISPAAALTSLRTTFTYGQCLTATMRLRMIRDCLAAVEFLHSHNYVHCDIKSLNFLGSLFILSIALIFA